jgi:hypothetical protein
MSHDSLGTSNWRGGDKTLSNRTRGRHRKKTGLGLEYMGIGLGLGALGQAPDDSASLLATVCTVMSARVLELDTGGCLDRRRIRTNTHPPSTQHARVMFLSCVTSVYRCRYSCRHASEPSMRQNLDSGLPRLITPSHSTHSIIREQTRGRACMSEGSHSYPPLFHHLLGSSSSPCHNHGSWPNQAFLFSRAKYRGGKKIGSCCRMSDDATTSQALTPRSLESRRGHGRRRRAGALMPIAQVRKASICLQCADMCRSPVRIWDIFQPRSPDV